MHKFEYWAHRLVPHLAFDDFIEKAENLGGKKPIKVRKLIITFLHFTHVNFSLKNALQDLRDKLNIQAFSNDNDQASHTLVIKIFKKKPDNLLRTSIFRSIFYQQLFQKLMKILQIKLLMMMFQMMMN